MLAFDIVNVSNKTIKAICLLGKRAIRTIRVPYLCIVTYTFNIESALSLAIRVARFGSSSEQQPEIRPWLLVRLDVCVT